MGGFRGGEMGGMRYGGAGGYRGGYGGMSSFGRTPSFSSPGSFNRAGGESAGITRMPGARLAGRRTRRVRTAGGSSPAIAPGSYTTGAGGDHQLRRRRARRRSGPAAARPGAGSPGSQVTTAGGRSFTDVGRAGGAVGPGGNAVGGRSNVAVASGPRGTAVGGSRSGFADGPGHGRGGGAAARRRRGGRRRRRGVGGYRGYGAAGFRPYGYNAYGGYHPGWVHGYWNGHDNAAWGWRNAVLGRLGLGRLGLGHGHGAGLGPVVLGLRLVALRHGLHALLQPLLRLRRHGRGRPAGRGRALRLLAADRHHRAHRADESVADPAMALFDAGRASFKQGNYADALQQTDAALATLPNDTTLHEFRALCLFALGRYDEAAATLYAVLSVGPGWDWTTLIGLYPDVDVYTAQLRALEDYCNANPNSAPARFVLAYHYLTQGHTDAAVDRAQAGRRAEAQRHPLGEAAPAARPAQGPARAGDAATAPPSTAPADTTPPAGRVDRRDLDRPAGRRHRDRPDRSSPAAASPGRSPRRARRSSSPATSTFGDGILTLAQDKGPALVGRVSWKDAEPHDLPRRRRRPRRPGAELLEVRAGSGRPEEAESSISGRREPHPSNPPGPPAEARRLRLVRGGIGRLSGSSPAA